MKQFITYSALTALMLLTSSVHAESTSQQSDDTQSLRLNVYTDPIIAIPDTIPSHLTYDSGVDIPYPSEGVKGLFASGTTVSSQSSLDDLVDFISSTDLNAVVIDVKEDYGNIVLDIESEGEFSKYIEAALVADNNPKEIIALLESNGIYPIARVVTFKDTILAEQRPDLSFSQSDGSIWKNGRGEAFVNPYMKEVWEYTLDIAKKAAMLGFKDIQFDYVRFPEGFEVFDSSLTYSRGVYEDSTLTAGEQRINTINEFVKYAHDELQPFGVDVSVDIFGYAAFIREAPGIGQSFLGIAQHVDAISSMIYPSHWGPGNFDIPIPDLDPYNIVDRYMKLENDLLGELGDQAPKSRPWIQDFTASYLGYGNYKEYTAAEVTEQVKALADNGIHEFLIWDASNQYSRGSTYSFND